MRQNTNINVRLSSALKTNIERHAKRQGMTIAQYTRSILLKQEVETASGLRLYYEDTSLQNGTIVYLLDYGKNKVQPEDGNYTLTTGKTLAIREGKVASSKAELRPAELSEMIGYTTALKKVNNVLRSVYNNIQEISLSDKSSEFRMSVAVAKNTGFTEIQKLDAMAKTLEMLTEKSPKNVTELIARIKKNQDNG